MGRKIATYWSHLRLGLLAFFFCIPVSALNPEWKLSQYAHSAWRMQDGTFTGSPLAIAQTTDGYVWIGTNSGVLRFDGVRFVPLSAAGDEQLGYARITALLGASDGSLWIGYFPGGNVWRWKDQHLASIRLRPSTQPSVLSTIVEGSGGSIWTIESGIAGNQRMPLCRVDVQPIRCYGSKDGIPFADGAALASDSEGNLWIGSNGGNTELVRWNPRTSTVYHPPGNFKPGPPGPTIRSVVAVPDGSAWIGIDATGPGPRLQRLVNGIWRPFRLQSSDSSAIAIRTMYLDRHNQLWIGTAEHGLYRLRIGELEHFGVAEGLTSNSVTNLLEDQEGNLWVTTNGGVDCFRQLKVASYSHREGLSASEVDSVLATNDGTIWVGGYKTLDAFGERQVRTIKTGQGLPGAQVTSMLQDHLGRLWVGTDDRLWLYQAGRFVQIQGHASRPVGFVTGLAEDTEGNIWATVRAETRRLIRIRDLCVQEELAPPQVPAARPIAADPHGGIWLGLMSGDLARYRQGRVEVFRFPRKAESYVKDLKVFSDGTVLGATMFGLLGLREGRPQVMTSRNGLPCNQIYTLIKDSRDDLWLYTQCGLVQITSDQLARWWERAESILRTRVLDAGDGTHPEFPSFNGSARSSDGRLWFATGFMNLQVIDPAHLPVNAVPPPVHIEEVRADHRQYAPVSALRLPPRTRDLALRYTAPSFVATQKVHFRYKLDGLDTEWQEAGTRREAFYTNLRPGSYNFRVIACNNDGVWNKSGAAMSLVIPPALVQTTWFRTALIALAVAALWLLYQLRLRRLRGEHQARLAERLSERERIARELHDTLLQGVQGLVLGFQLAAEEVPVSEPARGKLDHWLGRADHILSEGRERVLNLRVDSPESGELALAFEQFGEAFANSSTAKFRVSVKDGLRQLHPIAREEIYKIGREAITNAFQHAEARKIEVELGYLQAEFQLRVRDDGRGIEAKMFQNGRPGHWGLLGMRERAQQIGASLRVWSHPGDGTDVELTLPARTAYRTSVHGLRWPLHRRVSRKTATDHDHWI